MAQGPWVKSNKLINIKGIIIMVRTITQKEINLFNQNFKITRKYTVEHLQEIKTLPHNFNDFEALADFDNFESQEDLNHVDMRDEVYSIPVIEHKYSNYKYEVEYARDIKYFIKEVMPDFLEVKNYQNPNNHQDIHVIQINDYQKVTQI